MVVQKSIDNLKGRPEEERKVVAGGIAVSVIVVLLVIWALVFFHRISAASPGSADYMGENLQDLRDNAAAQQISPQDQVQPQTGDTGFGTGGIGE